jgi:hypothetical protein
LLALSSPWVVGAAVAFHLAQDDHHVRGWSHQDGAVGLEIALHGHTHDERTRAHEHPLLTTGAATAPGRLLLLIGAMVADAPVLVVAPSSDRRPLSLSGPTHDPPPRPSAPPVLRI